MIPVLLLLLAQTQPAVRRSTPLADDPGMVVRQAGTVSVNCTNCGFVVAADGGFLGVVSVDGGFLTANQGVGQDGGAWNVWVAGGSLSVSSSTSFDGGSIGFLQMPDGGAQQVYVVNPSAGWVPDGGNIGFLRMPDGGPVEVYTTNAGSTSITVPDGGLPVNVFGGTVSLIGTDVFSAAVVSSRYNQVEVDYAVTDPDAITTITVTKTNGGDATNAGGQAVYSTGTNATGGIKAVTIGTTEYRPHAETYAAFTAIFTTGVANSYQRVGIFDTTNGFFVGYEGTDFGLTLRKAGVDTFTPRASWTDPLTGGAGSRYTRNGVPEAMDPTKDQLWRIRYGWLGAANVIYEIMSPDGNWVTFYTYKHPNTTTGTSINNPNLPITLDARKTSGATNLIISTACWAAGSTSDLVPIATTINDNTLASMARAVITGRSSAGGGTYVNVKVNPSGALTVAATQDSFPWLVAGADGGALPVTGNWWTGPDGGSLGSVVQGAGQDGGAWNVSVNNFPATWFPDGGTIGAVTQAGTWVVTADLRDASVVVTNFPATWAPDGGSIGSTVVENTQTSSNYPPNPSSIYSAGGGTFTFDPGGSLATRSQTTTDEGSFSDGFPYLAYPLTGTVTMTNGSTAVTGVGTAFTTEVNTDKYLRFNTDPLGSGGRVASVESDTALTLEEPYTGAGGTGVVVASNWTSIIPDGGLASVDGGSFFVQNSGTSGSIIAVYRALDYAPIDLTFRLAISARRATETVEVGLHNAPPPNDDIHALFEFTGTDNTVGFCKTSFSSAGAGNLTAFTMPNGGTTDTQHLYSVGLTQDRAAFFVDNVLVCTSQYAIPGPYQPLLYGLYVTETGTTASPALISGTWAHSSSYNRMDAIVQNAVPAKLQAQVQGPNAVGSPVSSNPLVMGGSDGVALRVLNVSPQGEPIVIGSLGNNSNPPGTNNVGALTAVSTAAAPTYSEGNLVALSTDNSGSLRTHAKQGASADGGVSWAVEVTNSIGVLLLDGGFNGVVTQGAGQDGGAWNVSGFVNATQSGVWSVGVNNFPATQTVTGTVTATVAFDGGSVTATQGPSRDGGWNWPVEVNNVIYAIILDGGASGGGGGTVTQGPGQDGGAWAVYVTNPSGAGSTVNQGLGYDGGGTWGVWIEGGNLNVSSSIAFDGGSIGYMQMPDGGPLEVTLTSGTISIASVTQGAGQDGGAWNVAGTVAVSNFPATQPVSGTVTANAGTGTFQQNLAQYGGVAVGAGNAVHVQPGTGATFTVTGTVAATQSGTWSTRTQDGSGNAIESAVTPVNGANRGFVVRPVLKTATNTLAGTVSCATTATALPATALTNRQSLCVQNNGTSTIFLGGSGVTTATGFPLSRGSTYCDDVGSQVLFCIVAAGTENARVLEQ